MNAERVPTERLDSSAAASPRIRELAEGIAADLAARDAQLDTEATNERAVLEHRRHRQSSARDFYDGEWSEKKMSHDIHSSHLARIHASARGAAEIARILREDSQLRDSNDSNGTDYETLNGWREEGLHAALAMLLAAIDDRLWMLCEHGKKDARQ